jgi:hypothetical protein
MRYLILITMLFIYGCENVRHKIGITTKPFSKNDGFENSTKLNYSIIFGKVRVKKTDGTEDGD